MTHDEYNKLWNQWFKLYNEPLWFAYNHAAALIKIYTSENRWN